MERRRYLTVISLILWLNGAVWAQATVFTWSGRITDNNTGRPIANVAVVTIGNMTGTRVAVTDANGNYTLPIGGNTNLTLRAYRTNYLFNPLSTGRISGQIVTGAATQDFSGTALPFPLSVIDVAPVLLTEDDSLQALTLNALTRTRDPLAATTPFNFSSDTRTRLVLLLVDLDVYPNTGETLGGVVTVTATDAQSRNYSLTPEDLRKIAGFPWLSQLTVRVPPELANVGQVNLTVAARGQVSNAATMRFIQ